VTISSGLSLPNHSLENLLSIRCGVGCNVGTRERLPSFGFPRRITDHASKIADDKDYLVAKLLKLSQFVEYDCMAKMNIRRGRVEAEFHAEGLTRCR
jgi:hypothetical protein